MPLVKTHFHSSELYHDLKAMGRNDFSYEGAAALQEYLEQLADDCRINIEYDPIAFCCDYKEYSDDEYKALAAEYSNHDDCPQSEKYSEGDQETFADDLREWLEDRTDVIEFDGGLIVGSF